MRKFLLLMTAAVLLAACGVDEIPVPVSEKYERDFIKTFGLIDKDQTWRMVEQATVTVDAEEPSNVKAYVNVNGTYHIVADYKDVQGTQTLTFDVPANAQDVKVYVNGIPYGAEVDTRAFIAPDGNGVITRADEYVYYTREQIEKNINDNKNAVSVMPEGKDNRNVQGLKMDYTALVTGDDDRGDGEKDGYATYSIYPIFWNASYDHKFGLYYFDADLNKKVEIDFYENKSGDCLQYYGRGAFLDWSNKWRNVETNYCYEWYTDDKYSSENDYVLRGRRFDFRLPVGTTFGFYVNVTGKNKTRKYYSNPTLNANGRQAFSYFEAEKQINVGVDGNINQTDTEWATYICVEDIPVHKEDIGADALGQESAGDMDYNDFIFLLRGKQTHVGESGSDTSTPVEYYYAVEDLGGSYDYDFNDVVFSVSHVAGVGHLHVVPLAAGGILESFICYHGDGKEFSSNEVHSYFGLSGTGYVNTKDEFTTQPLKSISFAVPAYWSHTGLGGNDNAAVGSTADNGIAVKVMQKDGAVHSIRTPEEGMSPQMLILPMGWEWPTECTRIDEAYPGFGEWGAGYLDGTEWLNTVNKDKVVEHHHVLVAPSVNEDAGH
ncbi:MAG: LruC domain-containing protein [Bacteroidaceae bacterium]|nr:LruC domain-containing protein [Bacteroidaceae bacterium]